MFFETGVLRTFKDLETVLARLASQMSMPRQASQVSMSTLTV